MEYDGKVLGRQELRADVGVCNTRIGKLLEIAAVEPFIRESEDSFVRPEVLDKLDDARR